jgi:hypothetical protein
MSPQSTNSRARTVAFLFGAVIIGTGLAGTALALYISPSQNDRQMQKSPGFNELVEAIKARTTPPEYRSSAWPVTSRTPWGRTVSWQLEVDLACAAYLTWVRSRLDSPFTAAVGDGSVAATRYITGDAYSVNVKCMRLGPPALVSITFTGRAD